MTSYYTYQLDKLDLKKRITWKFLDEDNSTHYCTLNLESIECLIEFLREARILLETERDLEDKKI